jgi:hypothetical protein
VLSGRGRQDKYGASIVISDTGPLAVGNEKVSVGGWREEIIKSPYVRTESDGDAHDDSIVSDGYTLISFRTVVFGVGYSIDFFLSYIDVLANELDSIQPCSSKKHSSSFTG